MEEHTPVQNPAETRPGKNRKELLTALGVEGGIILVVLIVIALILNYFGVIPLSKKLPGTFGFLPQKNAPVMPTPPAENSNQGQQEELVEAHPFQCPLLIDDCSNARQIYDPGEDRIAGIAYPFLSPNLSILAIIDGTYTITEDTLNGIPRTTITIQESEGDLKVTYVFQGKKNPSLTSSSGSISQKEVIGLTEGDRLKLFDFTDELYSLSLTIENTTTGEILPFRPAEDGRGLIL